LIGRKQHGLGVIFGYLQSGIISIPFSFANEYAAVETLMRKYSDVPMSFADACLVRMSEHYRDSCIFTLDSDFLVYRKNGNELVSLIYPDNGVRRTIRRAQGVNVLCVTVLSNNLCRYFS
jgi:hypothetical protein